MKILVLSDSHGREDNIRRAMEKERPDTVIHLGDCVRDTRVLEREWPDTRLLRVRGNCDGEHEADEYGIEELGGVRIFFAHGHPHGVKMGLESFCNSVYFSGSALGLFGHTHAALHLSPGGIEILNPGSIGDGKKPGYAIVEAEEGSFCCRICALEERT